MTAPATPTTILHAYRHTSKALLRAVQYSKPARFVARDRIRAAFRDSSPQDYDPRKLARTIELLDHAARQRGLEHRIVKNLMHAWWERGKVGRGVNWRPGERELLNSAHAEFDRTIEALNASMGLCIK